MSIEDEIKPIGQYDAFIHMMLIASPGFGKTVFAGTAPNALFLTTDPEGTISAKAFGSDAKEIQVRSWDKLNEAFRWLRDGGIKKLGLEWVVIDNVSEAQNLGMEGTMQANRKGGLGKRQEFVPGMDEHQVSQLQMKDMVKRFHDLPVNILWTSWRQTEEDSEGEMFFTSGIHGQKGLLAQTIQGYMNIIGFGEVEGEDGGDQRRVIYFNQRKPYMAKDRYVVLGDVREVGDKLELFNMQKLTRLVNASRKKGGAAPAGRRDHTTKTAATSGTPKRPATRRRASTTTRKA